MKATIKLYNDNGDLISQYDAPPYETRINYEDDYKVCEYVFRFIYAEYVPINSGE